MMSNVDEVSSSEGESVNEEILWKDEVGSIVIKTWKLLRITRKVDFTGEPIKLKVHNDRGINFERVELEFLDGEAMIESGMSESEVLRKTLAFSIFSHIKMTVFSKDGRSEGKVFLLDGFMEEKPMISITNLKEIHYNDVDYVLIEFKDPSEDSDDDEEEEEEEEEEEGPGPAKMRKLEYC
jgi:hypothetical protein